MTNEIITEERIDEICQKKNNEKRVLNTLYILYKIYEKNIKLYDIGKSRNNSRIICNGEVFKEAKAYINFYKKLISKKIDISLEDMFYDYTLLWEENLQKIPKDEYFKFYKWLVENSSEDSNYLFISNIQYPLDIEYIHKIYGNKICDTKDAQYITRDLSSITGVCRTKFYQTNTKYAESYKSLSKIKNIASQFLGKSEKELTKEDYSIFINNREMNPNSSNNLEVRYIVDRNKVEKIIGKDPKVKLRDLYSINTSRNIRLFLMCYKNDFYILKKKLREIKKDITDEDILKDNPDDNLIKTIKNHILSLKTSALIPKPGIKIRNKVQIKKANNPLIKSRNNELDIRFNNICSNLEEFNISPNWLISIKNGYRILKEQNNIKGLEIYCNYFEERIKRYETKEKKPKLVDLYFTIPDIDSFSFKEDNITHKRIREDNIFTIKPRKKFKLLSDLNKDTFQLQNNDQPINIEDLTQDKGLKILLSKDNIDCCMPINRDGDCFYNAILSSQDIVVNQIKEIIKPKSNDLVQELRNYIADSLQALSIRRYPTEHPYCGILENFKVVDNKDKFIEDIRKKGIWSSDTLNMNTLDIILPLFSYVFGIPIDLYISGYSEKQPYGYLPNSSNDIVGLPLILEKNILIDNESIKVDHYTLALRDKEVTVLKPLPVSGRSINVLRNNTIANNNTQSLNTEERNVLLSDAADVIQRLTTALNQNQIVEQQDVIGKKSVASTRESTNKKRKKDDIIPIQESITVSNQYNELLNTVETSSLVSKFTSSVDKDTLIESENSKKRKSEHIIKYDSNAKDMPFKKRFR